MSSPALQQIDIIKIYEKKRCLIVDDITEVRAAYKRMLRSFGAVDIDTAATGDQAMQMCEARQYGMIICDYNLDESKDGQQVLEELRHMQLLKYTSLFIIITAETSREMVLGAIENQPDDYITKPISQKMMRSRLDRALMKHEELYQIKSAMDTKNYGRAIRLCDEKIKAGSRYRWECVRYKAQLYWIMGDLEATRNIYEEALEEKEFIWAKIGLAKTLISTEQYDNIEPILKGILRDDHRYIEAHDSLSEFYEKTRQHKKAQDSTQTATQLSPKSILRHRRLAELAEKNQDDETCLKAYEEAIRWNYNSCHAEPEDYLSLARQTVSVTKGRKDRDAVDKSKKALNLLERMTRRFPERKNKVKSGLIEAQLYSNQGKDNFAKSALDLAEKEYDLLEPKEMDARLDYAQSQLMCGDRKKAYKELHLLSKECKNDKRILEKVDKISDEPITVAGKQCAADLSRSGIEAYQRKDYDTSLLIFKDALKMFPNHTGVNLNMVQVALAKTDAEGQSKELYDCCKKCLLRVDSLEQGNKQYERFKFLHNQYQTIYEDFIKQKC
ncbi:MAG: CheY-like chemotaxis protein [Cellvibrionaceae bacterium]|jgi:CheY-like chemotaxis protein